MRYLIDAQLPIALARWLDDQTDVDSAHVKDVTLGDAMDTEIWDYAKAEAYIIVTKDRDFVVLQMSDPEGPRLLWIRLGNLTNKQLIKRLETDFADIQMMFADAAQLVKME